MIDWQIKSKVNRDDVDVLKMQFRVNLSTDLKLDKQIKKLDQQIQI